MNEATAQAHIERMTAWDSAPTLSETDVAALVTLAKRADADGRAPSDDDWTETWDLNAAAAEGWRWKAAKAAGKFDVSTDGQSVSRSQIVQHCRDMADEYRRKIVQQVPVYGTLTTPYTRAQEV